MKSVDVLIVGAGPAGMSAATVARRCGLSVTVVDEQDGPGGQIWNSIELTRARDDVLGPSYTEGRDAAAEFRACGATFMRNSKLWQIEKGFRAFLTESDRSKVLEAKTVVLATGAQERPNPFIGWTLPGVLSVGAAQILLKNSGQIPSKPVWIAGCGPLPLLYATQLLKAGDRDVGQCP